MVKSALKITISGTIQGLFFKNFAKENADKLNLRGFIRCLENGDLEVFIEGEKDNVARFVEILKTGQQYSQIRNIKTEERKWSGDLKEFKVLRI